MKFNCIPKRPPKTWRRWFAWYPVQTTDGTCRWLEFVERREWSPVMESAFGILEIDVPQFRPLA